MGTSPDQIRAEIEATREEMSRDLNRLLEYTSPWEFARRGTERMRGSMSGMRERVKGNASGASDTAHKRASEAAQSMRQSTGDAAEAVRTAPRHAARQTEGNPLAAGLIAFVIGLLVASVLPGSRAEKQAVGRLSEQAGDITEPVKEAAKESAQRLKEEKKQTAQRAGRRVKESVTGSAPEDGGRRSGAGGQEQRQEQSRGPTTTM